jgi:hypothetical protein
MQANPLGMAWLAVSLLQRSVHGYTHHHLRGCGS